MLRDPFNSETSRDEDTAEVPRGRPNPNLQFTEHHYTVAEVAAMWNLSKDAVRRMFQNEPGVLLLGNTSLRRRKRPYTTLRIPQSVVQRVHSRCSLVSY
jgi:hypothetical protein